jgi:GNAT superfamily N-acetyltransferase
VEIRLFEPHDAECLAPLLEEMQAYYEVYCPPREEMVETLRNLPPGAEILIASTDRIIGMAGFGVNFPGPGLKPGFFLKDLYVLKAERGSGIGSQLMQRLAELAVARGLTRIDWTASSTNEPLQHFYSELGGELKDDRVFFRLTGAALDTLAKRGR